jgi:glycerol-3-phosphate acyltransferase PlsY
MLLISPSIFLVCAVVAFGTIGIWRYVSLGSMAGGLSAMICGVLCYTIGQVDPHFFAAVSLPSLFYLIVGPSLVILFHRDNIGRLLSGKESKIGQKVEIDDTTKSAQA